MEIVVSLTILTVVMAGLLNFFISARKHTHYSRSRVTAAQMGRYFLDPLKMQVRQDQWGNNCLSKSSACSTTAQNINSMNFTPTYTIDDAITGSAFNNTTTTLERVKVTISWNEY